MLQHLHRLPIVFRIAILLLIVVSIGGQFWQRQPAGTATKALLHHVATACPAAALKGVDRVADGALVLDRAVFRLIADRYAPLPRPRCGKLAPPSARGREKPIKHDLTRGRGHADTHARRRRGLKGLRKSGRDPSGRWKSGAALNAAMHIRKARGRL